MSRPRIRPLLVAALSGLALLAVGPGASVAKAEPPPGTATHVMTWNLFAPGGAQPPEYAREIGQARPDVLGVQEACKGSLERTLRRIEADYGLHYYVSYGMVERNPWRCGLSRSDNFGNALLSLTPIKDRKLVFYSQGGSERRGYLSAITTVDGQDTRVFVTHLAQAGQADVRAVQVKELVQATAPYNQALILGDFNADPFRSEFQPLWKVFRDVDPNCGATQNAACTPTADADPQRKKFDYVLFRGLTSTGFSVVDSEWSDHDQVTGHLRH